MSPVSWVVVGGCGALLLVLILGALLNAAARPRRRR
jgi:hypothetical protein